jgi:hypothetical protein
MAGGRARAANGKSRIAASLILTLLCSGSMQHRIAQPPCMELVVLNPRHRVWPNPHDVPAAVRIATCGSRADVEIYGAPIPEVPSQQRAAWIGIANAVIL